MPASSDHQCSVEVTNLRDRHGRPRGFHSYRAVCSCGYVGGTVYGYAHCQEWVRAHLRDAAHGENLQRAYPPVCHVCGSDAEHERCRVVSTVTPGTAGTIIGPGSAGGYVKVLWDGACGWSEHPRETLRALIPDAWKRRANDQIAHELGDHRACDH